MVGKIVSKAKAITLRLVAAIPADWRSKLILMAAGAALFQVVRCAVPFI